MSYIDNNGLIYLWSKIKTAITSAIANKVDKVTGKQLSTNDYTTVEKTKLSGIANGAEVNQNAFSHVQIGSTTLSAEQKVDVLTLEAGTNVTLTPDAATDKITISSTNTTYNPATGAANGLMSAADKAKLDGVSAGANNYVHPAGDGNLHVPATGVGNQGKLLRAGTTAGSLVWGNLSKTEVGLALVDNTPDSTKPISGPTKTALDMKADFRRVTAMPAEYSEGITTLHLPALDAPSTAETLAIASPVFNLKFNASGTYSVRYKAKRPGSTDTLWSEWVSNVAFTDDYAKKLDGVSAGANNYTHPVTHPATIIVEDASHRFATDSEKGAWNAKASTAVVTTSANGLMAAADKVKLNGFGTASTYALKTDIVGMYKYKGTVSDVTKLPTTGQVTGDVYNITTASVYGAAGANVAWDGTKWDSLGEIFTITSVTNAEIDTICV